MGLRRATEVSRALAGSPLAAAGLPYSAEARAERDAVEPEGPGGGSVVGAETRSSPFFSCQEAAFRCLPLPLDLLLFGYWSLWAGDAA